MEKLILVRFISVWDPDQSSDSCLAAYYEAVPLRASRLRVSAPTVTHTHSRAI